MSASAGDSVTLPPEWLSIEEAKERLNRSARSVLRLVADGKLASKLEPRPGRKPERVFSAQQVAELARNHSSGAVAVRKAPAPRERRYSLPPAAQMHLALPQALGEAIQSLASALAYQADSARELKDEIPAHQKLWLSLKEATLLSGLAQRDVLKLAQTGRIVARKSGGWKILRKSLEAFEG